MKYLLIAALFLSLNAQANCLMDIQFGIIHFQDTLDQSLEMNQAVYEFEFFNLLEEDLNGTVFYSIDGVNDTTFLDSNILRVPAQPGIHKFEILVNLFYMEVFSEALEIKPQSRGFYHVYLTQFIVSPITPIQIQFDTLQNYHIETLKPVIYLYPEETKTLDIQLSIDGRQPFYYPKYENGWNVTAQPNGKLEINGESFRYLFWEAIQAGHLESLSDSKGFVVESSNALQFLEEKLTQVGFTSEEKADFITFWGPQIAQNEKSFVRFEWNETCDKFAKLSIDPKPDHVNRLYIFIAPTKSNIEPVPQILPEINRSGFSVLEWGGQISKSPLNLPL